MTLQGIGAIIGFVIIALVVWKIAKRGIPESNGSVDGVNSFDPSQGGDGF